MMSLFAVWILVGGCSFESVVSISDVNSVHLAFL